MKWKTKMKTESKRGGEGKRRRKRWGERGRREEVEEKAEESK
jgi:hypothetical protein